MAEDQQLGPCHLLALPRELRDIIYEYAFSDFEVHIKGQLTTSKELSVDYCNAGLTLGKQIHHEAITLYYTNTPFFSLNDFELRHWMLKRPTNARKNLKHIKMMCVMRGPHSDKAREKRWEDEARSEVQREFAILEVPVEVELLSCTDVADRLPQMGLGDYRRYGQWW